MSALDDIIARDAAPQQGSALDAIIARDAGQQPQGSQPLNGQVIESRSPDGAMRLEMGGTAPAQDQPGYLASLGAGLGHGVGSTVLGAQQLLGQGAQKIGLDTVGSWLVNDANQGIRNLDSQVKPYSEANPITTEIGNIGGQVAATAPMLQFAPGAQSLMGRLLVGGGLGAAGSALSPVSPDSKDYWGDKLDQVGMGAAFGAGGTAAGALIGKAISGFGGDAQKRLVQAGVNLTPGQALGGAFARTEEKLTSVPILGDLIKNSQGRAVQSFNRAAYQEALKPIGETLPKDTAVGAEAINAVRQKIGSVYQRIQPKASFVADQNFANDIAAIRSNLAQDAPSVIPQFDNIVENQVSKKLVNGTLTGSQWGDTRSMIAAKARNQLLGNASPDNRTLSGALDDLNDAINAGVARSSPPDVLQDLQKANAAWARYKQIESAAGMAGASNQGNIFTPAQFQNAIRKGSTASQKATNSGLSGELGSDAQSVLGSKYPDSGSPGRAALMIPLGALTGHAFLPPEVLGPALAGGSLLAAPYTRLGQALSQALLTSRPAGAEAVAKAVNRITAPLSPLLGAALSTSLQR